MSYKMPELKLVEPDVMFDISESNYWELDPYGNSEEPPHCTWHLLVNGMVAAEEIELNYVIK
jgi:hypothetical protein